MHRRKHRRYQEESYVPNRRDRNHNRRNERENLQRVESENDSGDNRERERTLYCGRLDEKVTEEILYELFFQAGPVEKVKIVKNNSGLPWNFGFITYKDEVTVPYALKLYKGVALFGTQLLIDRRSK